MEFRRIEDVEFADDEPETDEESVPHEPEVKSDEIDFILDGQQRITSIYKLFPTTLVPTEHELESRFKGLRFFLDLNRLGLPRTLTDLRRAEFSAFFDPDAVANAIVEKRHPDLKKEYRQLSEEKTLQRLSEDNILFLCQRKMWLPLTRAFLENKQSHLQRMLRAVENDLRNELDSYDGTEPRKSLEELIQSALYRWADWFTSSFQATLNSKTLNCLILDNEKPEGLARIFETINSTGLNLSVFDLLVARLGTWQEEHSSTNLRKLILAHVDKNKLQKFDDARSLGGTSSQQLPRLLALRTNTELKKGEILKTRKSLFLDQAKWCGPGLNCAISTLMLHMGVIDDTYLPFKDLIALIGAVYSDRWDEVKDKVIAYLWTQCLVQDWDSSTNDKTRAAYRKLHELIEGRLPGAELIADIERGFPEYEDVRDATSKASIVYRTLLAFNLSRWGIDWAGIARSPTIALEDHHLFPRDWLHNNRDPDEERQLWASLRDSVLNRIFVSKEANSLAKAQTPPNYLSKLTSEERRRLQIPESFLGPLATPIKAEAFGSYLRDRYELIRKDFIDYIRDSVL